MNRIWRKNKYGAIYLSPEGEDYMNSLMFDIIPIERQIKKDFQIDNVSSLFRIIINGIYYFVDRRKRDTHNYIKILADGLKKGLGIDDQHFLVRELDKFIVTGNNHCILLQLIVLSEYEKDAHYKLYPFEFSDETVREFINAK